MIFIFLPSHHVPAGKNFEGYCSPIPRQENDFPPEEYALS
jgi:hypothetical protein